MAIFSLKKDEIGDFSLFKGKKMLEFNKAHENVIGVAELIAPNILLTGAYDGSVKAWDIGEKKQLLQLTGMQERVTRVVRIDDRVLAVSSGKYVYFWDWANQTELTKFSLLAVGTTRSSFGILSRGNACVSMRGTLTRSLACASLKRLRSRDQMTRNVLFFIFLLAPMIMF
jgi:WD40 repeat protein